MRKAILTYGLPVCMVLVAGIQFYLVYFQQLSRWKGGGFGMYSDCHPGYRQVWGSVRNSSIRFTGGPTAPEKLQRLAVRVQMWPSDKNLNRFAGQVARLYQTDSVTIAVWEPVLNPADQSMHMRLLKEFSYAK